MFRRIIFCAAFLACGSVAAVAADRVATATTPFAWSGLYFGVNGGGAWGDKTWSNGVVSVAFDVSGAFGGAHLGYNWQANNHWVFGIEGEIDASSIDGSAMSFSCAGSNTGCRSEVNWLGMVSGRVGYVHKSALFYVKGGAAFAGEDHSFINTSPMVSASQTRTGWMVGGGAEWAFAPRWSARIEYNYIDMGNAVVPFDSTSVPIPTSVDQTLQLIKVGLSYKFK